MIVELISATTTKTGLTVRCELDTGLYPSGIVVSDAEIAALNIKRAEFHGEWEKRRCSILFHLLVPGGRWLTTMSRPSSLASFCSSRFHSRTREPLLPPPPVFAGAGVAVISNRVALG